MIERVPMAEQETTVTRMRTGDLMTVYTSDTLVRAELERLRERYPDTITVLRRDEVSTWYSMPKAYLHFRAPIKRNLSAEQVQKLRERLRVLDNKCEYTTDTEQGVPLAILVGEGTAHDVIVRDDI